MALTRASQLSCLADSCKLPIKLETVEFPKIFLKYL